MQGFSRTKGKIRQEEIASESDFYGAMDGASKFVKGDAIAAIFILLINIIGGLIIGITQHDLPISVAAENYVLLSIGDGLILGFISASGYFNRYYCYPRIFNSVWRNILALRSICHAHGCL